MTKTPLFLSVGFGETGVIQKLEWPVFQKNPYNKFKNDADLRGALKIMEIRRGVVGVASCVAFALTGADITPEIWRWLGRTFL